MTGAPVFVAHALGRYPVYIEPGALARLEELAAEHLTRRRLVVVADGTVLELLQTGALGRPPWKGEALAFPPGEVSKSREEWGRLTDALLARGFGRDSGVIALGGGVAGDLAGFVSATYMRGLPYLQAPTTVLAMVDASVGGKTGVDTPQGKNLVGAFHPPVAVVADPRVLKSLPEREYRAGLAEAVKHGLIAGREYFEWMERDTAALLARDEAALTRLVRGSVEIKAEVVSGDEREAGRRAVLNAGHTVAHALEQATGYGLPHGEAVALGLVSECELAERLGLAAPGLRSRVASLLERFGLPVRLPAVLVPERLLAAMASDKKNRAREIRFALPTSLGLMDEGERWTRAAPEADILAALEASIA
ncbi:MAG: 3-dehydroquinate synthase [Gemmatimonadales bacterium]